MENHVMLLKKNINTKLVGIIGYKIIVMKLLLECIVISKLVLHSFILEKKREGKFFHDH
jgi:hypothetical protein